MPSSTDYRLQEERKSWRPKIENPDAELIEKWASQGVPRKQMAKKLGMHLETFHRKMRGSKELIQAELRGKQKYYE